MRIDTRKVRIGILLAGILLVSVLLYLHSNGDNVRKNMVAEAENTYALASPAFVENMAAETSFLDKEAGISLYMNAGKSVDLSVAKTVFKTVEKETVNYTIGSIALPNLPETEDVHCFVHKQGWIAIYYLKTEPVGKIVDWSYWSGGQLVKNKLQVALEQICNALGVTMSGAEYYHFQYPYANKCMIVVETVGVSNGDSFTITIPSEFTIYERSWSHYDAYYTSDFSIDGTVINSLSGYGGPLTEYGTLTIAQLGPSVTHTVGVSCYDDYYASYLYGTCIALVYLEP